MANANEIRVRHYLIHLELPKQVWSERTIYGKVIMFLEPLKTDVKDFPQERQNIDTNTKPVETQKELQQHVNFECILDCCDLVFDSVYEVILPNSYKERFNDLNANLLTFEERKEVDLMRKFFR